MANHDIIIPQAVDYEMCRGFRLVSADKKKAVYNMFLQDCKIAEMDVSSWKRAEEIYENLYRKGFTVGELDILIAAYCLNYNYTIVTNNIKDFENIDGLIITDWTQI